MGLLCCKYFDNVGFVGIRIKERPEKPTVYIRNSEFGGIERIYLWDDVSRYSEGMNEFGVTIISNNFTNEKVAADYATKFLQKENVQSKPRQIFEITNNIQIRKALIADTVQKAINTLLEFESTGVSIVFDSVSCFLLKSLYLKNVYYYTVIQVPKEEVCLQFLPVDKSRDFNEFTRQLRLTRFYDEFFKYIIPSLRTETTCYESLLIPAKCLIQFRPIHCNSVFSTVSNQNKDNKLTLFIDNKETEQEFQFSTIYK